MSEPDMTSWSDYKKIWPAYLWTLVVFIVAMRPMMDFDTFWQLQSGKYILETHHFLYRDTFSITPYAYRLEHCWLSDIIFYFHYLAGGFKLLSLLKTIIITICGFLLYRYNVRRGVAPWLVIPVLTVCLAASIGSWEERPQLWTILFSILYIHILHKGRELGSNIWFWLVPIMLLWANLHAGCIFGFVLIGLFIVGEIGQVLTAKTSWKKVLSLAAIGMVTFGVSFINPYGSKIPLQLLAHLNLININSGQQAIMEWLPPTSGDLSLFYLVFAIWGFVLLIKWKINDPAEVIFFCAFLYMGTSQIRHSVFVPLLTGYYLPTSIKDAISLYLPEKYKRTPYVHVGSFSTVIALTIFLSQNVDRFSWGWGLGKTAYPVAATEFILNNKLPPTIYNFYDWGGYLIWKLYPVYMVFVDGRNTSAETLNASNRIDNSWEGWREDFKRYDVNTVISRTCYYDSGGPVPLVDTLVKDPDWSLVYHDDIAVVFIKKDIRYRNILERFTQPSSQVYETMYVEANRLLIEDEGRTNVHLALGRSSLKLGRYTEALLHYSSYLEKNPNNLESSMMVDFLSLKKR